ncbi:MAG: hypothetical protein CBC34_007470 [Hyphomicrobiaceae bacterium TMED74]|nr:hypothetical protein [Filomicrobium sp.]RPG42508.1 MAG: hypothetical protein CBC34_007470 [Hyphomicrobiaceae bacterium TMED74]
MVIAGAEHSNADYETLIAHYNIDLGVVDPPAGLDEVAKDLVGRLFMPLLALPRFWIAQFPRLMWHHQK